MVNYESIVQTVVIALTYLFIIPFQLIIFPMNYYSVKESIYSSSIKKATKSILIRFIFIFLVCLVAKLLEIDKCSVIWGVTIGSFLCTWPSIYQYQLFIFWKNKSTFIYFVSCIISVLFSLGASVFAFKGILPVVFQESHFYLVENNGISLIFSIISISSPFGMRGLLNKEGQENPYIDSDTFLADLCFTKRKILFENRFEKEYEYEIYESAKKYNITPKLLTTIIQLERINRDILAIRLLEKICVKYLKWYLIKKNATLGVAQIDIKTAKDYFHAAPEKYLSQMLDVSTGIDLCAFRIRKILEAYDGIDIDNETYKQYEDLLDTNHTSLDQKLSIYLASEYVCNARLSLRKFVMIYATLIEETCPSLSFSNCKGQW